MALIYPNKKIPYHIDGTRAWFQTGGPDPTPYVNIDELTSDYLLNWNSNWGIFSNSYSWPGSLTAVVFIFPYTMDISHMFFGQPPTGNPLHIGSNVAQILSIESSPDTVDGTDGTWDDSGISPFWTHYYDAPLYWNQLGNSLHKNVAITGANAVRVYTGGGGGLPVIQFFGDRAATGDRLAIWHPSTDNELTPTNLSTIDSVVQGTSGQFFFRVKNLSGSLTASDIEVSTTNAAEANSVVSGTILGQFDVNNGSDPPANLVSIDDLGPGDISPVLSLDYDIGVTFLTGPHEAFIQAAAGSWA